MTLQFPTIADCIGQTPLVRLQRLPGVTTNTLLVKLEGNNPAGSVKDRPALSMISRAELLERLNRELNELLNQSITLQLNQKQLQSTAQTLRTTLDEQLFWIPSNKPLDLGWVKQLPQQLERQLGSMPWGSAVKQLWAGLTNQPLLFCRCCC